MKNPFKGNTLACGLLGFILGIGVTFGAQQICSKKTWGESHHESGSDGSKDNFVNVETDVNGDVFFTKSGSKYHYEGCSSLSLAKETKRTTREKGGERGGKNKVGKSLDFLTFGGLVIRLGLKPRTHSLEGCCSIQLSYRTRFFLA